jgi:SNF2 family DNA or RNA helicase
MKEVLTKYAISHVAKDYLRVSTFHGNDRGNDARAFTSSDVVLTTYMTLVKDYQNANTLYRPKWFRVVLDEGTLQLLFVKRRDRLQE